MPDIDMLGLLAEVYGVSVEELLRGERLPECAAAPRPNPIPPTPSPFTLAQRTAWLKRKWRREHAVLLIALAVVPAAALVLPLVCHKPSRLGLIPLVALAVYAWQHNRMMSYVEHHLYDR